MLRDSTVYNDLGADDFHRSPELQAHRVKQIAKLAFSCTIVLHSKRKRFLFGQPLIWLNDVRAEVPKSAGGPNNNQGSDRWHALHS